MKRKNVLSPLIILLLTITLLSAFNLNTAKVAAGEYPSIYIEPAISDAGLYDTFDISIKTDYVGDNVTGWQLVLAWNPSILECTSVTEGTLIPTGPVAGRTPEYFMSQGVMDPNYWNLAEGKYEEGDINNVAGELTLTGGYFEFTAEPAPVVSGEWMANVTFEVVGYGISDITIGPETKLITYSNVTSGTDELGNPDLYGGWGEYHEQINAFTMPENIQHGYFENMAVVHDVNVVSVTPSPTVVDVGDPIDIDVEVKNEGSVPETFDVNVYHDSIAPATLIGTQTVTDLASLDTTTLTIIWDTTGVSVGNHSIITVASTVPGETDTEDNVIPRPFTPPPTVKLIGPIIPMAVIHASDREYVNEPLAFDGSVSWDVDGYIVNYTWNFDDGTVVTVTDPVTTHEYTTTGIFGVTLVVTDNDNLQSNPALHTIEIVIKPLADLVKWKAKPEAHRWSYSKDANGLLTLTALARNLATQPIDAKITFAILDARFIGLIPPIFEELCTLGVPGEDVPVSVDLDPYYYGWHPDTNPRVVLYAHVTFEYYHSDIEDWIPTLTKIVRFSINP